MATILSCIEKENPPFSHNRDGYDFSDQLEKYMFRYEGRPHFVGSHFKGQSPHCKQKEQS